MRNVFLETMILKLLHEQRAQMSFLQIMHRVEIDVAQPYLTRDELFETIRRLEYLELIAERKNFWAMSVFLSQRRANRLLMRLSLVREGAAMMDCVMAQKKG